MLTPWKENYDQPRQHIKKQRHYFVNKGPLSMGFSRQEYWSGLPCPPPGNIPDPGVELSSHKSPSLAVGFFTTEPPGKPFGLLIALLLNSGLAAHCLNTNTLETSVGRKGKVTLFRRLATGG